MKFEDALALISRKFEVQKLDGSACEIMLGKMFDEFNYCFLALRKNGEGCFLSDYAQTAEITDADEQTLAAAARECGLIFDDFYIKCDFASLDDIEKFSRFFDLVSRMC